jgi:hypothetical protein
MPLRVPAGRYRRAERVAERSGRTRHTEVISGVSDCFLFADDLGIQLPIRGLRVSRQLETDTIPEFIKRRVDASIDCLH